MWYRRITVLVACVAVALACGGVDVASSGEVPLDNTPDVAPAPKPKAAVAGLGGELGFPLGDGGVQKAEAKRVEILHVAAFDAGYQWDAYKKSLEEQGWVWKPTVVPPFKGLFEKDGARLLLECELAGTSVWVKANRL